MPSKLFFLLFIIFSAQDSTSFKEGFYFPREDGLCYIEKGHLVISKRTKNSFEFYIRVANKGGIGEIEGKADLWDTSYASARIAVDLVEEPDEWTRVEFSITPDRKWIHITTENSTWWHGAQVCFDGFYRKR